MSTADLEALRSELGACRQRVDAALGRALQFVAQIEAERLELQRDQRLTQSERQSIEGAR